MFYYYLINIVQLHNGTYTPDGFRFAIYIFILELPLIFTLILAVLMRINKLVIIKYVVFSLLHLIPMGIYILYIPYVGIVISGFGLLVSLWLLIRKGQHPNMRNDSERDNKQ
jgi:uncharacterized BrkB/YihY/UPF0761 family membrane protein